MNNNGQIYTEETDKANILVNFFTEQTLLDESQVTLPQTKKNTTYKLYSIIVTQQRVRKNVHKYLFSPFQDNNVITAFQSGFAPSDSAVNQLTDI